MNDLFLSYLFRLHRKTPVLYPISPTPQKTSDRKGAANTSFPCCHLKWGQGAGPLSEQGARCVCGSHSRLGAQRGEQVPCTQVGVA